MRKLIAVFLATLVLAVNICMAVSAAGIVLPDDDFGTEPTAMRGDVNGDGKIDHTDLSLLSTSLAGGNVSIGAGADVDVSGKIDQQDRSVLALSLAGADVLNS